jgi:GMP synthase-like glutamine amidotransferase
MHVLVFQHVHFEGLGAMAPWLDEQKAQVQVIRQYEPEPGLLPALSAIDLIIVLGGPMSVHDADRYPWLEAEKAYIQTALRAKTPILGLCLGAQLIAEQLGGSVRKNLLPEIGWWPIHWHDAAQRIWPECQCADKPELEAIEAAGTRVFHWHGETFDLPAEAQPLAHSAACVNQGFLYRDHVVGLQFHLEMTPETVEHLLVNGEDELVDSPFVSTAEKMKSEPADTYALNQRLMGELLQYLVAS